MFREFGTAQTKILLEIAARANPKGKSTHEKVFGNIGMVCASVFLCFFLGSSKV